MKKAEEKKKMPWAIKGLPFVIIGTLAGGVIVGALVLGTLLILDRREQKK